MSERERLEQDLCNLLQGVAKGDRAAFTRLYSLTAPKFNAIVINMVRDPDMAGDILQRAYLSIWKSANLFDAGKGKAFTWMLVIMRNRSIDVIRERRRHPKGEDVSSTIADDVMRSDTDAKAFLLRRMLRPYLNDLPVETSRAIILNVVHGLSSREIGLRTGTPTHTIKSRIRRGLQKLRDDMGEDTLINLI